MNRPSPAFVIAIVALFVALGGTSYAITQLPKNSVGTPQLKKNAVTGAKVKDGSLTGADVNLATLGPVPVATAAERANSAQTADSAGTAASAQTANSAGTAGSAGSANTATRAETAGRADTAASADSATTAGSATSAGNAITAGNAQALNGKTAAELIEESKLRCPAGMKLAAGVCIDEAAADPAALYVAFQTCGEENFRLPTQGELIAYVNYYDATVTEEWTEPEIVVEGGFKGVYITASKGAYDVFTFDRAFPLSYRCVTTASN